MDTTITDEELAALLGGDTNPPAATASAEVKAATPAVTATLDELEALEVANAQPATKPAAEAPVTPPARADDSVATPRRVIEGDKPTRSSLDKAVKQYVDPSEVRRDVTISAGNIEQDLVEHSALVAYYGSLMAQARRQRDRIKTSLEIGEARIAEGIRAKYAAEGTKVTEARVEQLVRIDPAYASLRQMLDEANASLVQAEVAIESFRQRSSMLIQLSAGERVERAGDLAQNRIASSAANAMNALKRNSA